MSKVTIPEEFICPITGEIMQDPVTIKGTKHTFERTAIEKWWENHNTNPITNLAVSKVLISDTALKEEIAALNLCKPKELLRCIQNHDIQKIKDTLNYTLDIFAEVRACYPLSHHAALYGSPAILKYFLKEGMDANALDEIKRRPLHCAASVEHAQMLLKYGAQVNAKDINGNTALHSRAYYGHDPKMLSFLVENGADLMSRNMSGNTPLHICALRGTPEMLEALLKAGANLNVENNEGEKPIDLASQNCDPEKMLEIITEWPTKKFEIMYTDLARQNKNLAQSLQRTELTCANLAKENQALRKRQTQLEFEFSQLKKQMAEVLKLVQASKIAKDEPSTSAPTLKRRFFN